MAIELLITFFVEYFNKVMVIFSKNKRNHEKKMEKIVVCTKMMLEKNVCGDVYV